ncbi:MAG: hypothetical protein KDD45_03555 [Bdellovibrionales bacterium]|nr:hypothetical protein [Bdellovibrionales bacterium]
MKHMPHKYKFICSEIWKGKSVLRAYLNFRLSKEKINGKTIDIGGGKNADYLSFMGRGSDVKFETFDIKAGQTSVDFETDRLPANDGVYETVLFLNVMEHIYNHQHIADEVVRITKAGGQLIGFVPFLMWYHPDHRDFFRYTHEALEIIFSQPTIKSKVIDVVGEGPFLAAAHMILLSFPRLLRPVVYTFLLCLDKLYKKIKGKKTRTYALGYVFVLNIK